MTTTEFYEMIKEYAKKEMLEEGKKSVESASGLDATAHQAASHEAAKFYQFIEMAWLDYAYPKTE